MINKNWTRKKIFWLFNQIGSGTTPSASNEIYYNSHDIPWLNTSDLKDDYIVKPTKYISQKAMEDYSTLSIFPEDSLVIAMYGATIGKLGITKYETTTNQACCVLSEPRGVLTKFIFYWLMAHRSEIINLSQGGGQPNISQGIIKNIRVTVPPIEIQNKIVKYIDKKFEEINSLIDLKNKFIELLEQQRQAIITEAVTKGLNPNVKMKDSGVDWIGEINESWEVTKIVYHAKLLTGGTPDKNNSLYWENGTINWMASGEINKEFIYEVNSKITELGMRNSAAKMLPKNSVMIALNGQGKTKGKVAVLKIKTTCNQSLAAFICNEEKLHYLYLYYYLKSKYKELRGLVGDGLRDGISLGLLKSIKIPFPSINEQLKIANYLFDYDKKITEIIQKEERIIQLLKEYRQSLIYEVVTGKIDIREMELD